MRHFVAAVAILGASCLLAGCAHEAQDAQANAAPPPPTVVVGTVRKETVPISTDYEAVLGAIDSVQIRARVQGQLEAAPFKEGAYVQRNALIFRIQQNEYQAALQVAKAQLATAQAQKSQAQGNLYSREAALTRANTTVARNRPLAAQHAIPQKDLDNAIQNAEIARGDVTTAQAQIASANAAALAAQAAIQTANINLGYTTIYAPVSGLIGFLNYDIGNVVGGPGTEVLDTITVIDPIKVTFALDEPTYLRLSRSRGQANTAGLREQSLKLILANDQKYEYPGKIYTLNPTIDPKTGSLSIEARFPNPSGLLRPGGFARVRLLVENRIGALTVPQTAISKSQGVDIVYVVDDKDQIVLRSVSLGPAFGQQFVVQSGLKEGDRVVVEGTQKVQPGMKVIVKSG